MNTKNISDLLGEYSGEKNEAKPKSTIERTIENCKSLGIEEIDTDNGTIPIKQLCKADCPFKGDGGCPIDKVIELDNMGALWGEMELLQWYSTGKTKCPTAEAMISDFLDEDIYSGEILGAHQFAYVLIVLGFGAPLDAVKGWLREAIKNGNADAKKLTYRPYFVCKDTPYFAVVLIM